MKFFPVTIAFFSITCLAGNLTVIPGIAPSPEYNKSTLEKIELGKTLFFDPRLSSTKTVSCNSCHNINGANSHTASGTDNLSVSSGVFNFHGERNSPTLWNIGLRSIFFWDGRASTLEEQAKGPILNPLEMGILDNAALEHVIQQIPGYRPKFLKAFPKEMAINKNITADEIAAAIASFERTLMTPDSPFDLYQKGDSTALSNRALKGWEKFQEIGCIACHGAPTFTSKDYFIRFPAHPAPDIDYLYKFTKDNGRYNATHDGKDKNLWRVPSLRNVAITGPYFHNGAVDSLEQAVRIMGKAQLGKIISDEDVQSIVEFLKSLSGKIPLQVAPTLPR